jgi:uncharacterized membrane protein
MPLIYDPEYQAELEKYADRTSRKDRVMYWLLLWIALVFAAVFWALRAAEADMSTIISAMIAVATLGVAWVVIVVWTVLHANLVIVSSVNEWYGKKMLGEYISG